MRASPFYSVPALIHLYKPQVLPSIESWSPAYYHAAPNILKMVDSVQDDFLSNLGVPKVDALVRFNLAPLNTRRDISLLGVLHKIT